MKKRILNYIKRYVKTEVAVKIREVLTIYLKN